MLKLPQKHTSDEKANGIIVQYLNGNILKLVKDEIADYEDIREKEARENDLAFCRAVSMFFPEHYPFEKMGKVFLGLQALLESEYEFVPELAMEYVMYSLIQARIGAADDLGIRMFSAPMGGTDITNDGCIGAKSTAFYELRGKGGAAAVTVSECMVHPKTDGSHAYHLDTAVLNSLAAATYTADAIRRHGAMPSLVKQLICTIIGKKILH